MSFFDNIRAKIFPNPVAVEQGKVPILSDVIKRDEKYIMQYQTWLLSDKKDNLVNWVKKEYGLATESGSEFITKLKSQGIHGFLIHGGEESLDAMESRFLMDYWKGQMKKLPYRLYTSHSETFLKENKILIKEKYYFKPSARPVNGQMDQEYGNVLFESEIYDDELLAVKCIVTFYNGFNYLPPKNYEDLAAYLVGQS